MTVVAKGKLTDLLVFAEAAEAAYHRAQGGPMPVNYEEWMSDGDASMWNIERDPVLRSTVMTVWFLDRAPDLERFEATFDRAVQKIPRFRQRVVTDGLGVATPRWEDDTLFDRAYHLRRLRAPGEGNVRDLLDLAAPIAGQAFDKDRPLWEFHLVEGLEEDRLLTCIEAGIDEITAVT